CFRFRQGGFDALVFDQTANLIGEQRFAVFGFAAEAHRFLLMSHMRNVPVDAIYLRSVVAAAAPLPEAPSTPAGVSTRPGSNFIPRLKPSCWSLSLISLSDFFPKLRYFNISLSVFCASWPTVVMLALFKQLAARTLSSISFTLILSNFLSFMFSSLTPAGVWSNSIGFSS